MGIQQFLGVLFIASFGFACSGNDESEAVITEIAENHPMLHVALQEGFNKDAVTVRLNELVVYEESEVTTDLRIGRADALQVELKEGPNRLEILVPRRDMSESLVIQNANSIYVGASIEEGGINLIVSNEPFGYL